MSRKVDRIGIAWGVASLLVAGAARGEALDCVIEPWRTTLVSAAIEGVVQEVLVDRGDAVVEGQIVARLESSVEAASLEVADARANAKGQLSTGETRLDFATRDLTRHERLGKSDVVSSRKLDEAMVTKQIAESSLIEVKEALKVARLERKRVRSTLDRRVIRSPINGVVTRRILGSGEYADPPQIMEIAQLDPLRVEVFAPLAYLDRIAPGDAVVILPEEPVGGRYAAQVDVVDRVVDAASGTFGVRIQLPNPARALPAGLRCKVDFSAVGSGSGAATTGDASAAVTEH